MILLTLDGAKHSQILQTNTLLSKCPWITPELTELMRERDCHLKQAHKTNSEFTVNYEITLINKSSFLNLITSKTSND